MKHWMVSYPGALWGDVFVDTNNRIGCIYDAGLRADLSYYSIIDDKLVLVMSSSFNFPEVPMFVRADKNQFGQIAVLAKAGDSGNLMWKGPINPPVMSAYGTHSFDIIPSEMGFRFAVQRNEIDYFDSEHGFMNIPSLIVGTSQGMIQMTVDGPLWSDLQRETVPEMFYPFITDVVTVGEGRTDPPHMQALEGDKQLNIYDGYAARPRACFDAQSNLYAVAARSENGVNFHFYRLPFEEKPMACTPVVPPQNIVRDSTEAIRKFCQEYRVPDNTTDPVNFPPGSQPYKNDEIHQNGLFLSDGLLYFMMSDTGRWAQVLMNPDDKRDWESKRKSADDALFNYMRARCGDNTSTGGLEPLDGEVNVNG